MGKHNVKTGVGRDRSRNRRGPKDTYMAIPKRLRRPRNRLGDRREHFNNVMTKSMRYNASSPCYRRPGSMKHV